MNRPKLDTIESAIAANLDALSLRLAQASTLALSGAAAMAEGRRNLAIGTVLDLERTLPEIQALFNAALALHRGKGSE
jgi:hypothetical protein